VLFAGPPDLAGPVNAAGFRFWQFDPPPEEELGPIWGRVPELAPEEANGVVVREIFGRLNTSAALPRLRAAVEQWRPDVVVRDPNEYGAALAAELHGIPHARGAIGLASTEELGLRIAAGAIDAIARPRGSPLIRVPSACGARHTSVSFRSHSTRAPSRTRAVSTTPPGSSRRAGCPPGGRVARSSHSFT
jgi:hypothetical protein